MENQALEAAILARRAEFLMQYPGASLPFQITVKDYSENVLWSMADEATEPFFCASAFKVFVLVECLRQWESGALNLDEMLFVTDAVKSPGGDLCKAPDGTQVTVLNAMQEMIANSDNTATDLLLARVGPDNVRRLLQEHNVQGVVIPDRTRRFILEVFGISPDLGAATWEQIKDGNCPIRQSPFTVAQRMAAPAATFVQFYGDACRSSSAYWPNPGAYQIYLEIMSLPKAGAAIKAGVPYASRIFFKGGSLDLDPYHVISAAGRLTLSLPAMPPSHIDFAFIFNTAMSTSQEQLQLAFLPLNVDILSKVARAYYY